MPVSSQYPALKFQVQEAMFDATSMKDETNFYSERFGKPSILQKTITYILGNKSRNYPLSLLTMGGEGYGMSNTVEELDDVQFLYPVMGHDDKVSISAKNIYSGGDKPGIGNSRFKMYFADNWIKRFYILHSEDNYQVYIHGDGKEQPDGLWEYDAELHAAGPEEFLPPTALDSGKRWIDLFTQVAESESRSTESKMVLPGMFRNQMGFMRAGMSWAGNAANKVMTVTMKDPVSGKETTGWMDYFMWQFENRWISECEHYSWYSRYNRQVDGTIALKDLLTGKVIPTGSGLLEQITNKGTFADLTYSSLMNKVGNALFGQNDTEGMTITLMGGTGGRRDFHKAIMKEGATFIGPLGAGDVASKFVTGTGNHLMLGGFFDGFYHIDGYTIKFKHNPIFDCGKVAKASPLHPVSGLPLESHRLVFLDTSDVDGRPNIRHVAQKGRAYMDGVVNGLTPMPKSLQILLGMNEKGNVSKLLSTVQDKSEYTRFKSGGIQLMRGNRCFDLQCIAGL